MSYTPKTPKLQQLGIIHSDRITELETCFLPQTNIYIDRSNVLGRQSKLGRHIDPKRLYQFLRSFTAIDKIRRYFGTLKGDTTSERTVASMVAIGYNVSTKPVKIMKHSVDMTSIKDITSPDILKSFITKGLLNQLSSEMIAVYNGELMKLNDGGTTFIEERKCNFDVEIGVDMMLDDERMGMNYYKSYILRSGDSDFTDIVQKLISQGKQVCIFSTTKRVSRELASSGAFIFDIQKIRDFICRNREISTLLDDPIINIT